MRRLSRSRQGIVLVALSCVFFGISNVLIRHLGHGFSTWQVAFLRSLLGMAPVAVLMRAQGMSFATGHWPLMVVRGMSGLGAISCFFWALVHIPMATATMFNYTAPVFATVFAVLFMGERLKTASLVSLLLAFSGMVLMLKPSFDGSPFPYLVALAAGLFSAVSFIVIKKLTSEEPVWRIVFWFNLTASAGLLPLAVWTWRTPDPAGWGLLVALAATATAGQMLMTAGFERGQVSLTGATSLLTVVVTAIGGWLLWGETVTGTSLAGMAMVGLGVLGLALWAHEDPAAGEE